MLKRKKVAILQSSYIPWKGYFDIINSVDEFILLDSVQYTKRDWRNRNVIVNGEKLTWLTIPVKTKGLYHQRIEDVRVLDHTWAKRHFATIRHCYCRSAWFESYERIFSETWENAAGEDLLCRINKIFIEMVCNLLKIKTKLSISNIYEPEGKGSSLILDLCIKSGASVYITGPKARNYLEENTFTEAGIQVIYFDYKDYPEYPQQSPLFRHNVSVIDLILNTGPAATDYMLSFK